MVILDVQLWELGTQRLHQGLSETILLNTLTDVRGFKKTPSILSTFCDKIIEIGGIEEMLIDMYQQL